LSSGNTQLLLCSEAYQNKSNGTMSNVTFAPTPIWQRDLAYMQLAA